MLSPRVSLDRGSLQRLLDNLLGRASQAVQAGSRPLFISGHRCGWLFSKAADALTDLNDVEISPDSAHIGRLMPHGLELDALLALVAATLRQAGCAPGWRNELLDVWPDHAVGQATPLGSRPLGVD